MIETQEVKTERAEVPEGTSPVTVSEGKNAEKTAGFGAMLRDSREAAGLSLDDISSRTKISREQLEALEAENVRLLPESVYIRAFIRDICRTTGADPEPMIRAYSSAYASGERKVPDFSPVNAVPKHTLRKDVDFHAYSRKRGIRVFIGFAVLIALVLAAWVAWSRGLVAKVGGEDTEAAQVLQEGSARATALQRPRSPSNAMPANAPAGASLPGSEKTAQPVPADIQKEKPAAAPSVAVTVPASEAKSAPVADAQEQTVVAGEGNVTIRTIGGSWVKLTDATGRVLLQGNLKAGEERTVNGKLPIRATVGNAAQTAVSLNGNPVNLAGFARGSVARFVLK